MSGESEAGGASSNVGELAKAVVALTQQWPVYPDVVQPAAKEVGKTLHTVARVINVLAAPLRFTAWSGEQIEAFVKERVLPKLQNTPEERLQAPPLQVGVPALEALRYTGSDPELSELYANLLANAMDASTARNAHPAFVEIIRAMTQDDARAIRYFQDVQQAPLIDVQIITKRPLFRPPVFQTITSNFSMIGYKTGCENPVGASVSVENLVRLGLLTYDRIHRISDEQPYEEILASEFIQKTEALFRKRKLKPRYSKHILRLTELGRMFIVACVNDKAAAAPAE